MLSNYEMKQKLSYILLGQRGGQSRVQIINSLLERPYNINQLAESLGLNYRTIKHHITMLLKHGLIGTSHTGGYGEVYFVSPELETRLPMFREIADKLKTITASPKLFQSVMEQTNDAVVMVDEKLDVIFWNRSAEGLFGHTGEEVMGGRLSVFPDPEGLRNVLAQVTAGKKVAGLETRARTATGKDLDLELTIDAIRNEENRLVGFSMICKDITDRKLALEALLVSQQRYALAQQAARILSWEWDIATDEMRWSERPGPFLGLGAAADLGTFKAFLRHVHPADRTLVAGTAESIRKRGRDISIEHRLTLPDGRVRWVRHTGGVIRDDRGKAQKLVGIIQDITERRDAERRYARILETSLDGFCITDMKGRFLEVNEAYCRMVGHGRRQLLKKSIKDVEAAERPSDTLRHIQRLMRVGSDRFETRHRRRDGSLVDLDVSATYLDSEGGRLVVFLRDITGRKRSESELRLSEQRYALAQKAASIGSWDWDIASGALKWSDTIEPMFGFSPGKFKGTYAAFLKCVHPDDRARLEAAVIASTDRKKPYDCEHRIVWPDGSVHWMAEKGEVLRDGRGKAVRMLGVVQDVTDRKQAEERMRHLASFPRLDPNPVMELDLEGNVVYSNPVTAGILDGAGLRAPSELRPADFQTVQEELRKRPEGTVHRDIGVGGRVFRLSTTRPPGLPCYRVYGIDITDRVRAEEKLKEAQAALARKDRIEALGRLAGATGQELSVPLTAIKNAVHYLGMVAGEAGPEVAEVLEILRREVGSSEALLRNLGDIAAARPPETGRVDLGELLSRTLADMRIGGGIAVERRPDGDLPPVMADAGQLGVVFRNIIQNAVEAMPGGGKLEVGAAVNGSNVEVTVRDTGRGMSGAEMGRLFDPFFTTKPRGIGLGLPVARQLVEGHGGTIRVDSRPGSGSTFTVILPVGKGAGQ